MTAFPCCTCPEPPGYDPEVDDPLPKYRNKCGCPTATVICESVQKNAQLCGFSEFTSDDYPASIPPRKYKQAQGSGESQHIDRYFTGWTYRLYTERIGGTFTSECSGIPATEWWYESELVCAPPQINDRSCSSSPNRVTLSYTRNFLPTQWTGHFWRCPTPPETTSNTTRIYKEGNEIYYRGDPDDCDITSNLTITLKTETEDTEADALARANETDGTSCTSIYELRTTSFSLTVRTVKFSLELTNLCRGRAYEGCVRIRKRKAFSGTVPEGEVVEWEDVEPFTFGPITPTAANTTDGVTTTSEITDQDLVGGTEDAIGWEYEIVSAHVWPVSAGCDCPTELGYTDPE